MNKTDVCVKCKKRKFTIEQGIICSLTNAKPTFEETCPNIETSGEIIEIKKEPLVYLNKAVRPNKKRAKQAILLIAIVMFVQFIAIISDFVKYLLLDDAYNGAGLSYEEANSIDQRQLIIAIIFFCAQIISSIYFIKWFRRAYFNLHQKINNLNFTEGWAAGAWFVPIVNILRPYNIMAELYTKTKEYINRNTDSNKISINKNSIIIWWTLWITQNVFERINFQYTRNINSLEDLITSTKLDIISGGILLILGIITIRVIQEYSSIEDELVKIEGNIQELN